jgi:hypothetical protein
VSRAFRPDLQDRYFLRYFFKHSRAASSSTATRMVKRSYRFGHGTVVSACETVVKSEDHCNQSIRKRQQLFSLRGLKANGPLLTVRSSLGFLVRLRFLTTDDSWFDVRFPFGHFLNCFRRYSRETKPNEKPIVPQNQETPPSFSSTFTRSK